MLLLLLPPLGPGACPGDVAVDDDVGVVGGVRACMRIQPSRDVEARRDGEEREKDRDVMRSACEVERATEPEPEPEPPRWFDMVSLRVSLISSFLRDLSTVLSAVNGMGVGKRAREGMNARVHPGGDGWHWDCAAPKDLGWPPLHPHAN